MKICVIRGLGVPSRCILLLSIVTTFYKRMCLPFHLNEALSCFLFFCVNCKLRQKGFCFLDCGGGLLPVMVYLVNCILNIFVGRGLRVKNGGKLLASVFSVGIFHAVASLFNIVNYC